MHVLRPIGACSLGMLLGIACLACGCGGEAPKSGNTVYVGPQEEAQKKADLHDAMKGGAYGAAGRKSAGLMK